MSDFYGQRQLGFLQTLAAALTLPIFSFINAWPLISLFSPLR
jgi:hypothetical protein